MIGLLLILLISALAVFLLFSHFKRGGNREQDKISKMKDKISKTSGKGKGYKIAEDGTIIRNPKDE